MIKLFNDCSNELIGPRNGLFFLVGSFLLILQLSLIAGSCTNRPAVNTVVSVWFHSAQKSERMVFMDQVARFNGSQNDSQIKVTIIPEGSYNGQVQASAVAGDLPDLLEFDGPYMYTYAWQGLLLPLDTLLEPSLKQDLLPSLINQGTYRGKIYAIGTYDSGLGLYGRKSDLEKVGVRVPAGPADAWTIDEFQHILAKLSQNDDDGQVLDLKLNYSGEWYTYAFSPLLWSAGGALIDRERYDHAEGVLNGKASVQAMSEVQKWFNNGYVDPNLDDAAFVLGRVALSLVGHWEYRRYREALGEELLVLTLPDFGQGVRTGQGSWTWSISRNATNAEGALQPPARFSFSVTVCGTYPLYSDFDR